MDLLIPPSRFSRRKGSRFGLAALLAAVLVFTFGQGSALAEDALPPPGHLTDLSPAAPEPPPGANGDILPGPGHLVDDPAGGQAIQPANLQLEVLINGYKINLVAGFNRLPDGGLSSARSELREIGIKAPGQGKDDEQIALASIPGVTYKFDEAALTVDITAPDGARIAKAYDIMPKQDMLAAEGGYGAVLNYSAYGAANTNLGSVNPNFSGASAFLDARAYAPFGVLRQTGTVGTTTFDDATAIRLDTTWTSSSQERAETYRAGDFISGSLGWTRPVRMGGVEAQRDFALRPDLITTPMASMAGSAAVPSTLDVFINGSKSFSEQIPQGPFEIDRLPMISSQGTAQMVITDTTGKQTTVETPLFSSPLLLAPHLYDYSVDLGLARRNYGLTSFDYDSDPMLIASGRYGVSRAFTAEAHLEAKHDLAEGGLGAVLQAGRFGTFNFAAAISDYAGAIGYFGYGSWTWERGNLMLHASSARTFGDFNDLAAATALQTVPPTPGTIPAGVPKAVDQANVAYGLEKLGMSLGAGVIHYVPASGDDDSLLLSTTLTKSFQNKLTIFANAYYDAMQANNWGFGVGFTMPLGGSDKNITASAGASYDRNSGASVQASAVKPLDSAYGSNGWRVSSLYGNELDLAASGSYRSQYAVASADVQNTGKQLMADARVEGSLVATRQGVFAGNPINDSFAVVNAGVPDVAVSYENRFVGKTGGDGTLLLTNLQSYYPGKVSIDPNTLPLNSNVTETEKKIAAKAMSGVSVDFGVKKDTSSALLILKDAAGEFVPAGSLVTLEGQKDPFPMGYDGQVYLTGLAARNKVTTEVKGVSCSATFDYKEDEARQVVIGPLTCG